MGDVEQTTLKWNSNRTLRTGKRLGNGEGFGFGSSREKTPTNRTLGPGNGKSI